MVYILWLLVLITAGGFVSLGWWSVQSLAQARLLGTCRTLSLAGLAGRPAALRGRVRVHRILRVAHLGDLLWHREIVRSESAGTERTLSDVVEIADFSILVGGEEVRVVGKPTEVQAPATRTVSDDVDVETLLTGRQRVTDEWIPVIDELTVVGRLRREERGWVIASDIKVGLLLTMRDPRPAATHETIKGWAGLAGAATGLAVVAWLVSRYV